MLLTGWTLRFTTQTNCVIYMSTSKRFDHQQWLGIQQGSLASSAPILGMINLFIWLVRCSYTDALCLKQVWGCLCYLPRTVLTAWTHKSCRVQKFSDNRFRVLHFLWGVLTCRRTISSPAQTVNQAAPLLFEAKDGCHLFEGDSWCAPLWTTWAIRLVFKFQ